MKDLLVRNNVKIIGEGSKTMILVHGYGCDQEMWRFIVPYFEKDYRLILIDLVGSGKSQKSEYDFSKYQDLNAHASDILEIIKLLSYPEVVFVGHSVSATIGALACNEAPDLFSSLIMVGPSPRYINDQEYYGGFNQEDIEQMLDVLDSNYLGWASSMAPVIMGNPDRPELSNELERSFCQNDPEIAKHFARATFLSDNRDDYSKVPIKTLVLQSKSDAIAPVEVGTYVNQSIPQSDLVVLESVGHCPHMSAPEQTANAMANFLGLVG